GTGAARASGGGAWAGCRAGRRVERVCRKAGTLAWGAPPAGDRVRRVRAGGRCDAALVRTLRGRQRGAGAARLSNPPRAGGGAGGPGAARSGTGPVSERVRRSGIAGRRSRGGGGRAAAAAGGKAAPASRAGKGARSPPPEPSLA